MQKSSVTILILLIASAFLMEYTAARCNVCNDNGVACISETSFQLCFNGNRDPSQTFTCPEDTICVGAQLRCMSRDQGLQAECPLTTICGECDGINMFTCTSRTTFVQCNGTEPIVEKAGTCPAGLICDSTQPEICVDDCRAPENPQCNNDAPQ